MKTLLVPIAAAILFCAPAAHAVESKFPMPNCNSKAPECGEWQQAVQTANSMAAQTNSGGGGDRPEHKVNAKAVIDACVRFQQRHQHLSYAKALQYCREQVNN